MAAPVRVGMARGKGEMRLLMVLGVGTLAGVYGFATMKNVRKAEAAKNESFDEKLKRLNK